jgi:hypothetical protein
MAKKNRRPMPVMSGPAPRTTEFNPDYSVIKRDLKRIAALATFFVLVLVGLSFFLR